MSQQVKVERELIFRGSAGYKGNITGAPITKSKMIDFGFEGTSTLYGWSSTTGANGCTLAHALVDGGAMTMTMGGVANDCGEFYHNSQWSAASNCGMLAKVKISQITTVNVCVGFVDAYTNTNDRVAIEMNGAALTNMSNTADVAGMVFDTNATTDVWYAAAAENGTERTPVAATGSLAPTADTYFYVAIQTNTAGDVTYYYGTKIDNLVQVGHQADAIAAASTDLLTPYVGFIARNAAAGVCTISRIVVWQDN